MTRILLRDRAGRVAEVDHPGSAPTELLAYAHASLERMQRMEGPAAMSVAPDATRRHAVPDATVVLPRPPVH